MRVGLDTHFFLKLFQGDGKALDIWDDAFSGQVEAVVPVCVLYELKRLVMDGVVREEPFNILVSLLDGKGFVVPADGDTALKAAQIAHGTGMKLSDALVCVICEDCHVIYTDRDILRKVYPKNRPRIEKL